MGRGIGENYLANKIIKMELKFEAKCILKVEHLPGMTTTNHVETQLNLNVSDNLDRSMYFDQDGLPNKNGCLVLTNTFIQGLIANIHNANQRGHWNDSEHIRYIIAELGRGFVQIANVSDGVFDTMKSQSSEENFDKPNHHE